MTKQLLYINGTYFFVNSLFTVNRLKEKVMKFILKRFYIISLIMFVLVGCSNVVSPTLTRVYFEITNPDDKSEGTWMILDEQSLIDIDQAFKEIKWEPNKMPSMSREEDVQVTLWWETDKNMPERLYEYKIWFNADNTATINGGSEKEGLGHLTQEETQLLKEFLLNTTDRIQAP
ncbi:hypothetical protein ACQKE5_09720 [Paenisporosarcina sp. NPDC076898]|uniref:hypothetical protein n=2 Tax=unclassified Paenisporosarcina TaxID=2642018 RepID=UPI003CFDDCA2